MNVSWHASACGQLTITLKMKTVCFMWNGEGGSDTRYVVFHIVYCEVDSKSVPRTRYFRSALLVLLLLELYFAIESYATHVCTHYYYCLRPCHLSSNSLSLQGQLHIISTEQISIPRCPDGEFHTSIANDLHNTSITPVTFSRGRATDQAVSRRLPTAADRVRGQVRSCGICGEQSGTGAAFLRVFRYPQSILIPTITTHSLSSIIRVGT
jgi:hypothetical protein